MKILIAQINITVGDLVWNTKRILGVISKYGADVYVFPELTITGYIPQDLLLRREFVNDNLNMLNYLIKKIKSIAIVGFVDRIGDAIFNSAGIISNQRLLGVYHKKCLPNYNIFDEKRWFTPGKSDLIFKILNKNIGINICEDIWFSEPTMNQTKAGAELIINISGSPYSLGKIKKIENIVMERHRENNLPILYVNAVGAQDGIVFYGHSMFAKNKQIIACKDFEEEIKIIQI